MSTPSPRWLRLVGPEERAEQPGPPRPRGPVREDDQELSAGEAAILLGVSEDDVVIRQRRGELPGRLTLEQLADDADGPDR